jgi:hypothetical protein
MTSQHIPPEVLNNILLFVDLKNRHRCRFVGVDWNMSLVEYPSITTNDFHNYYSQNIIRWLTTTAMKHWEEFQGEITTTCLDFSELDSIFELLGKESFDPCIHDNKILRWGIENYNKKLLNQLKAHTKFKIEPDQVHAEFITIMNVHGITAMFGKLVDFVNQHGVTTRISEQESNLRKLIPKLKSLRKQLTE